MSTVTAIVTFAVVLAIPTVAIVSSTPPEKRLAARERVARLFAFAPWDPRLDPRAPRD